MPRKKPPSTKKRGTGNDAQPAPLEELFTVKEVAAKQKCSIYTIWRRIKSGELHHIMEGPEYRIPQSAIAAYREAHSSKPDVPQPEQ